MQFKANAWKIKEEIKMRLRPSTLGVVSPWLFVSSFLLPVASLSLSRKTLSRRQWCATLVLPSVLILNSEEGRCADELPLPLRDFTKLAPLGKAERSSDKLYGLSLEEIARRLQNDLVLGATGQGGYILTGDLNSGIFRDDCAFVDPTNRVTSLSQYQRALRILFDPEMSSISLVDPLTVNKDERTIRGRYRSRGYLQLPWHPYVTAYESTITYKIGEDGLVEEQVQEWSKPASKALKESFTPSLFTPAPSSSLSPLQNEPAEVSQLFDYVNGRRPQEYSHDERFEIDALIETIVKQNYTSDYRKDLPGKWMLVYLQPGPDGAGIDRRVPFFPEFPFNDNYQIFFRDDRITNVGELFGPSLDVKVFGDVSAVGTQLDGKQRFKASIQGGKFCATNACIDLPISGEGLFDSVYLGNRIRIGQNLNGGGARVVQVRLSSRAA